MINDEKRIHPVNVKLCNIIAKIKLSYSNNSV